MLRKIIAAATLAAAGAVAIAPPVLARDRDHGIWQAQGNSGREHGGDWEGQESPSWNGHGNRGYGSGSYNGYYPNNAYYPRQRAHGQGYRQDLNYRHGYDGSHGY